MSNPVFTRLDKQWQPTPQAYAPGPQMPVAQPVIVDKMTYDDVIVRTGLSLATLTVTAAVTWWLYLAVPQVVLPLMLVGSIGGLIVAMVNIFSKKIRPALVLLYSALQGVAMGALSGVVEDAMPGVVIQAVVATVVVFGVTLLLFASGKVRNSPKLARFTLISLVGILVSRLLIWVLSSFGILGSASSGAEVSVLGIPLTVLISLFAVIVGALCLIGDFDQVKVGVAAGVPSKYAWASAFGIMVTVVWLYVEILNILVRINRN